MERTSKVYKIRRNLQKAAYYILPKKLLSKIYFKILIGRYPNIKNPVTFNEKLQWYKLNYCPKSDLVIKCTDKYLVREYLKEKKLEDYVVQLIYETNDLKTINWEGLPDSFVIKCTHGCAYNIIVEDKKYLDVEKANKQLKKWMKENFAHFNVEEHYKTLVPKVIIEEFLEGELLDFKFFCFNGKPRFLYVSSGLYEDRTAKMSFFDIEKNILNVGRKDYAPLNNFVFPNNYNEMVEIAKKLSNDFPFVRVDLFYNKGKIYFSELTFTPGAGMMPINDEYDKKWGGYFNLSKIK